MQQSKVVLRPWQRFMLNFGAGLGSLCLVLAILALVLGIKPLVFVSGSMGPSIPTGSLGLAVASSVEEINPGDVVSVINSQEQRITHRVVEKRPEGLVLKGDANPVADLETYSVAQADRLILSIPGLGYLVNWLSQPWVYLLGIVLCGYLLFLAFWSKTPRRGGTDGMSHDTGETGGTVGPAPEGERPGRKSRHLSRGLGVLAVAGLLSVMVFQTPKAEVTHAAFTGAAAASSSVQAATLTPATGALTCAESGLILTTATVSWPVQQLPAGARLAVRLQTGASTYGYTSLPAGATSIAYGPGLNLLGLITSGGAQSMEVKVLVVYTTDNKDVNETGSNIGWVSAPNSSPTRTVIYHPGLLLARDFTCT